MFLSACTPSVATVKKIPECNFYGNEQLNKELRQEIWGNPSHAAFDKTWQGLTSSKLEQRSSNLIYKPIEQLEAQRKDYKNIEKKLSDLKETNYTIISKIRRNECSAGRYTKSYSYLAEQTEAIESILGNFQEFYSTLDWYESLLKKKEKKEELLLASEKSQKELTIKRQELYRKHKGTTLKSGNLSLQLEDNDSGKIYISIKNNSKNKIKKLFTKKCIEYQNEQGGVSCLWETNASLYDQYGNDYKVNLSGAAESISDFNSAFSYDYKQTIELYPGEKKYFKFNTNKIIENTSLSLHLNASFLGFESDGATFKFPESFNIQQ